MGRSVHLNPLLNINLRRKPQLTNYAKNYAKSGVDISNHQRVL